MTFRTPALSRAFWDTFFLLMAMSFFALGIVVFVTGGATGIRQWGNGQVFGPAPVTLVALGAALISAGLVPLGLRPKTDAALRMFAPRFMQLMRVYFRNLAVIMAVSGTIGFAMALSPSRDPVIAFGWTVVAGASGGIWWFLQVVDWYIGRTVPATRRADT